MVAESWSFLFRPGVGGGFGFVLAVCAVGKYGDDEENEAENNGSDVEDVKDAVEPAAERVAVGGAVGDEKREGGEARGG